jgi:predicted RNA-binding Zn-ribbon protein involved in translation (DUF1610 family)
MGDKELRIRADELHRLGIVCDTCKSEMIFEAKAVRGPGITSCPNCGTQMPHVAEIVDAYRGFFKQLHRVSAYLLVRLND